MDNKVTILLAEDNPADKMLFEVGLRSSRLDAELCWVKDGVQVMNFLKKEDVYSDAPKPEIAILDLNMPRKGGQQIVEEIKSNEKLKDILTIVLTTSDAETDRQNCYNSGVDKFMIKPLEFTGIQEIIKEIEKLWFNE
ncbi:MAG: response regulator [Sedimentisphaeraceae bacterium JB056]